MAESGFVRRRAVDGPPYCEAGSGETIVAVTDDGNAPTRAHALLAEHRHVLVFTANAAETAPEAARRIGMTLAGLGVDRFDLLGEGTGAAAALWLALRAETQIGSLVLAAPDGPSDDAFRGVTRPVLMLAGTKDRPDAGERWRTLFPDCHFMLVYDAGPAMARERPQALAHIAQEFFERRHLFLVSRDSGVLLP